MWYTCSVGKEIDLSEVSVVIANFPKGKDAKLDLDISLEMSDHPAPLASDKGPRESRAASYRLELT